MLARINHLTRVLILSSSLISNVYAAPQTVSYRINTIIFRVPDGETKLNSGMISSVTGFRPGYTYTSEQVATAVDKAEDKLGITISNLKVSPQGELTADITRKTVIHSISFKGNQSFSSSILKDQIGFRAEGAYCEDVCDALKRNIEKFYSDQGYFDAKAELSKEVEDGKMELSLNIKEGKPSLIESVDLELEGFETKSKMLSVLSIKSGTPACSACIQESIKSARQYLYRKGYYASSVYRSSVRFSPDMKTAKITIGVNTGPRYKVLFRGNEFFQSQGLLKDALDISDTVVITPDYYPVLARKLADYYRSFGFSDVNVDAVEELGIEPGELMLVFNIKEGKQWYIGSIRYELKREVENEEIDDYLRAVEPEFFERGFFVKKKFEDMRASIEKYLSEKGYLRAKVLGLSFRHGKGNREHVAYQIDPGQPTMVRDLVVSGNKFIDTNKIISKFGVKKDEPVDIERFKEGLKWLTEQYRENGYADFYLDKERLFSYNQDYRFVDININIDEGERLKIGETFINGLARTKERVVTRELRYKKGDLIKTRKIQDTENALAGLGFLGSVSVEVLPGSVDGKGYRDVLISIDEKKAGSYEVGAGYRTDEGLKLFSGISYGNLGGWGRRIYANAAISRKLDDSFRFAEYDVMAGYYEPYLLNIPLDFRVAVETRKDDYPDYAQKKLDTAFYVEKKIGHHSLILRNAFERVNIFEAVDPADDASYWKYSIRQTYRYDTRDSIFSPTRGFNFLVYGEWGRSLNTQVITNYAKVEQRLSFYIPLFSKFTLMSSFDSGYVKGLKGDPVLLNDRFALGGFDSIRGYREGIIADLTPDLSRQQFYTFSVELRRLLFWNFVASVFHDMGSISSEEQGIHGTYSSVGGGLGIKFPVGSLSLQYGYIYRKDKRIPSDKVGRIHLAIGTF